MTVHRSAADEPVVLAFDGPVAKITLNRPSRVNAISREMALGLGCAIEQGAERADVIVVSGAGDNFSAGADLADLDGIDSDSHAMREVVTAISRAFAAAERAPVPVIAAVRGYALAGGFEFMQACDLVLVAEDAVIGDQHANFGLVPGGGGSQRLPRLCGRQRALGLLLTGDRLNGRQAVEMGLAYRAVPADDVEAHAMTLAHRLAEKSREGLALMKRLVDRGAFLPLDVALELEVTANVEHASHRDFREGISAFRQRREPDFTATTGATAAAPPSL
jgi:enoyl-CoA hydratase/carnithine racemase